MYLLRTNPENQEVFTLIRETIKDQNNEVNRNALQAFAGIEVNDKTKEARCDVFTESIDHANDDLSGEAAEYLSQPKFGCTARYDALLKSLDARVKAKKFNSPMAATALRLLCSEKAGSPAQMKTANGIARKLAEDKTVKSSVRADAIAASVTCDPKGAKALLGKFKKDADPAVKEEVARIERVAKNKKK